MRLAMVCGHATTCDRCCQKDAVVQFVLPLFGLRLLCEECTVLLIERGLDVSVADRATKKIKIRFPCSVCHKDIGWNAPSGVCSETCLREGQLFGSLPREALDAR